MDSLCTDLQQLVAQCLIDPHDCAALCLADPRIGLNAQRGGLPQYQGPLFCVALRLHSVPGYTIDEPLLRRYAADPAFTREGCQWLATAQGCEFDVHGAARSPCTGLRLICRLVPLGDVQDVRLYGETQRLLAGSVLVMRMYPNGKVVNFEGDRGAERKVRVKRTNGGIETYEGERDAERKVRLELHDGQVMYFEGERGVERLIRMQRTDGGVQYYEGATGAERIIGMQRADGSMQYHEGERGAERVVRLEKRNGRVQYYAGEEGAERVVRVQEPKKHHGLLFCLPACFKPPDHVLYCEGERGAERVVRVQHTNGCVCHYAGEKGAERVVRVQLANGREYYYEGEKGAERKVCMREPKKNSCLLCCLPAPARRWHFFEGEKGLERVVLVLANGRLHHYEGEKRAEMLVRSEAPGSGGPARSASK